ncbi:MAG: outer membrane beta-barrel protein [Bacteroidetes bacterium]|nr:outer membrane beta-barrel protein [Bacteroidota bacterium]
MKCNKLFFSFLSSLILTNFSFSQQTNSENANSSGYFSLGARSTFSSFGDEGSGIGTGGQFRIQAGEHVNTEWFADYIAINVNNKVRSEYMHIGWSVMYYPFANPGFKKLFQPYIVAGHCFDYNKMTDISNNSNSKNRWGSAVQAGIATHINLTPKFDISLTCQYMIHFTESLSADTDLNPVIITKKNESALQGHLLSTISFNYKIGHLWKK